MITLIFQNSNFTKHFFENAILHEFRVDIFIKNHWNYKVVFFYNLFICKVVNKFNLHVLPFFGKGQHLCFDKIFFKIFENLIIKSQVFCNFWRYFNMLLSFNLILNLIKQWLNQLFKSFFDIQIFLSLWITQILL